MQPVALECLSRNLRLPAGLSPTQDALDALLGDCSHQVNDGMPPITDANQTATASAELPPLPQDSYLSTPADDDDYAAFLLEALVPTQHDSTSSLPRLDAPQASSAPATLPLPSCTEQTKVVLHSPSPPKSAPTPSFIPIPTKRITNRENSSRSLPSRHASSVVSSPSEASAFLLGLSAADVMTSSDSDDEHRRARRRCGRRYTSSSDDSDNEGSLRRMAISLQIDSKGPLGWSRAGLLATAPQATASGNTLAAARARAAAAALIPAERPTSTSAFKPARFHIAQPDTVQPAASLRTDVPQQAEAGAESKAEPAVHKGTGDAVLGDTTTEQEASSGDANSAFALEEDLCSGCLVTLDDEPIQPDAATDQSKSGQEEAAQNDEQAVAQNESEGATAAAAAAKDGFTTTWQVKKTWWQLHAMDDCDAEDDADYFDEPLPWTDSQAADQAAQDAESLAAAAVPVSGLPVTMGPVRATGQAEGAVGQHAAADQATAAAAGTLLQLGDFNFGSISPDDLLTAELGDFNFGSISHDDLSRAELGEFNFISTSQDDLSSAELGQQGSRGLGAPSPPAPAEYAVTALNPSAAADVDTAVASPGTAVEYSISMSATAVDAEEVAATALVKPSSTAESPAASEMSSSLVGTARVTDTQAAITSGGSGYDDFLEPRDEEEEEGQYHEEEEGGEYHDIESGHDNGRVEHEGELQLDVESDGDARVLDTSINYTAFLADSLLNRMEEEAGGRVDQIKALSTYPCTASLVSLSLACC